MKIVAKGMIDPAYFAHGRKWPHRTQLEVELTADEYEAIASDRNIVSVVLPDAIDAMNPEEMKRGPGRPRKSQEA